MELPDWPVTKNKKGAAKLPPDGQVLRFVILDEIRRQQTDFPEKVIYLQKFRFEDGRIQFRLCYYIIGKKPGMKGKWVFGQYATMVPAGDLKWMMDEAERLGWFAD